jgi:hypothetical protein
MEIKIFLIYHNSKRRTMVTVDINWEEREIIVNTLKAYLGLHGDEFSEDEREKFVRVVDKIEAIPFD